MSVGPGSSVLTSRDGSFTLKDVPAGSRVLRVFYTGFDVTTKAGKKTEKPISFLRVDGRWFVDITAD